MEDCFIKDDYFGTCRGTVEDINDPEHLGRIRVRVPMIHGIKGSDDSLKTKELPWAVCVYPGVSGDSGLFMLPKVGASVLVCFEEGQISSPMVLGAIPLVKNAYSFVDTEGNVVQPRNSNAKLESLYGGNIDLLIKNLKDFRIEVKGDSVSIGKFNKGSLYTGFLIKEGSIIKYINGTIVQ